MGPNDLTTATVQHWFQVSSDGFSGEERPTRSSCLWLVSGLVVVHWSMETMSYGGDNTGKFRRNWYLGGIYRHLLAAVLVHCRRVWFVAEDKGDRLEAVAWPAAMISRTESKKLVLCCSCIAPVNLFWLIFLTTVVFSLVDFGQVLFSVLRGVLWKCRYGHLWPGLA